uniref:Uncharacterized protein n=1 Tax=Zea mays TaxID=4577 RepID=C4J9G5_MAIZE|nr:unknown [Zea mays]
MKAGCMGATSCLSCSTVAWDSGRGRPTTLMLVPLPLLAAGKVWRRPVDLRRAAGCSICQKFVTCSQLTLSIWVSSAPAPSVSRVLWSCVVWYDNMNCVCTGWSGLGTCLVLWILWLFVLL